MISRIEFRAMGCRIAAQIEHPNRQAPPQVLQRVPEWFEAWEAALSRFRPESELSRINRAGGAAVQVSEVFWQALEAALRAEVLSGGLVSAAVLPALLAAGYTASFEPGALAAAGAALPGSLPPAPGPAPALQSIQRDAATRTVRLPAGMQLDFGGVAKGWAAHQAMRRLERFGPSLVDAGGDLAASGKLRSGEPWRISVEDPRSPGKTLGAFGLGRGGAATSGIDYRRWQQDGRWRHHIIDPRSGLPAETDVLTATVAAASVMEAETAAKTMVILGSRAGLQWLAGRPGCTAVLALQSGQIIGAEALWGGPHGVKASGRSQ